MKKYFVLLALLTFAILVSGCGKKPAVEPEMGDRGTGTTEGSTGGERVIPEPVKRSSSEHLLELRNHLLRLSISTIFATMPSLD